MLKDFKEFAIKGNVIDMAVGVIIGGAFGKIVASVVNDLIMPVLGALTAGMEFASLKIVLSEAEINSAGEVIKPEAAIMYGRFIQTAIDFLIIAFSIFIAVRLINKMKKKEEDSKTNNFAGKPSETDILTEIRDLLKGNQQNQQ